MSGDALNIVIGGIGIVASVICSVVAYRRGAHASEAQKNEVIGELRKLVSNLVREIDAPAPRRGSIGGTDAAAQTGASDAAVDVLVQASLGALLDERGEVSLPRLFREVGEALGRPSYSEVVAVLRRLREKGSIEWDGPSDLSGVQAVRVCSRHGPDGAERASGVGREVG